MNAAGAGYELRLLGPPQILRDGVPIELHRRRTLALLVLVVLERRPMSRGALASMFWPDSHNAAANLRPVLSELRQLTPGLLEITRTTVAPDPRCAVSIDVHELERVVSDAADQGADTRTAIQELHRLVGGGTKELLEGLELPDVEPFEHWLQVERVRADHLVRTGRQVIVEHHVALGQITEAVDIISSDATLAPYDDAVNEELVRLLLRAGRRTSAVAHAREYAERLAHDLGIRPSASFEVLAATLVDERPPSPTTALPDPPAVPLIGRTAELDLIISLLRRSRLTTIVGAGGAGKTRVAVEAAHRSADRHTDGVTFVDLSEVHDPFDVGHTVASVLRLSLVPGPVDAQIAGYLSEVDLLLVLDSCEHVVSGVSDLVDTILASGSRSSILATSRRPLDVVGEAAVTLHPLSLDGTNPARQLFLHHARAGGAEVGEDPATLAVVDDICSRLDGLPLAIEVAAGVLERRSLVDLRDDLAGLRSGDPTTSGPMLELAEVVAWSLRLLSDEARDAFVALGVFAGSFDIAAAAAVTGRRLHELAPALDELQLLSLATPERGPDGSHRFRLLNTVAHHSRLAAGGALDELRERHARHHLGRAGGLDLFDLRDGNRIDAMQPDLADLALAFEHFAGRAAWAEATEIAVGCYGIFSAHAWTQRGRAWLERCLAHADELEPALAERARAALVQLCLVLDDTDALEHHAALLEAAVDPRIRAESTGTRAIPLMQTDPLRAARLLDEATAALDVASPPGSRIWTRGYTGFQAMYDGDLTAALDRFDTSIAEARLLGHTSHIWILEDSAASCELMLGLPDAVLRRLEGAGRPPSFWDARHLLIGLARLDLGDLDGGRSSILAFAAPSERGRLPRSANDAIVGLARLAAAEGRVDHAIELLGSAGRGRMPASIGVGRRLAARLGGTERVAELRAALEADGRLYASADDLLAREWREATARG